MSIRGIQRGAATVQRPTPTTGDSGEVSLTWSTVAEDVCCVLQVRGGRNAATEAGVVTKIQATVYFTPDVDVRPTTQGGPGDRLVIGDVAWRVIHVRLVGAPARLVAVDLEREA